ncbi:MAG: hypothetical protein AB7T06_29905 [Kofleriaceae bacterium]
MRGTLAIVVLLAGCDDELDLSGMYEVTSEVESAPCGADAPVTGEPFIKFTRSELFGTPIYNYERCNDAAGTDCAGSGGLFEALTEPIDNGWLGHLTSSSGTETGGTCLLGLRETRATLNGSHLVIEEQTNEEEIPYVEATCNTDEADRRGTDMPCTEHRRIEASKR